MKPRAVVLVDWPQPDTVTPALTLWNGARVSVMYGTADESFVIATFPRASALKVGGPNDEALSGHPLFALGLQAYSIHRIENSPWLQELERQNANHPSHDRSRFLNGKVHYLLALKEETVECLADEQDQIGPTIKTLSSREAALQFIKECIDA